MNFLYKDKNYDQRNVWIFFTLTFAWTGTFWTIRALISNNIIYIPIPTDALKYIGGLAPLSIAFLLTNRSDGKKGIL
ncbi:MAG: hypothetical protein P8X91_00295 [Candidatus Bathyarchaeota archaeon]|jgi:hypothetical protein